MDSQKDIARIRLDEASQRTVDREGRNEIRRRAAKENMSTFRRKATVRDRLRDAKMESSPTQSSPAAKNGQNIRTGGNADRDAKGNRKAADQPMSKKVPEERKVKNPQKKESQVEANKLSRAGL